jgi:hypothetical protein
VKANKIGVVIQSGRVAIKRTVTLERTVKRKITTRGDDVNASTTVRFITADATVLAMSEGDPIRIP